MKKNRFDPIRIRGGTPLLSLVILVVSIDSIGYGVVVPVLPVYGRELGLSDFKLGLLFAIYAIALLVVAVPVGMLADRWGRKPFILFGMFAMAASFVFYALARGYAMLMVARVLDGATAAANWAAALALLGDRVPESEMGQKLGWVIGATAAGAIAGPLLGGVLSDTLGYRAPFLAIAGACVLGGLLSLLLVEEKSTVRKEQFSFTALLGPVLRSRSVLIACLITVVTTTGFGLLEPTLPLYLKSTFSMSRTMIGVVFGITMAAYAIASPLAGKLSDALGRRKPILAGLLMTAVVAPLVVVFENRAAVLVLMGVLGACFAVFETPSFPLITDSLTGATYGTAFGLLNFSWSLGYALGPLLGGAVKQSLGLLAALLLYSGLLLVLAVVVALALKPSGGTSP
ncbi:MAG: MFS transporter [Actinobacteria bacterium]|nr:MFS transporter [Actinomycetota bacterium]MBU1944851.1 MFS transporter [Actinomycetota bacterium]MBU2687082.1 MFS transporter [Actinomycetota bacterium]